MEVKIIKEYKVEVFVVSGGSIELNFKTEKKIDAINKALERIGLQLQEDITEVKVDEVN